MACQATENNHQDVWYIDTGCSNHMSGNKSSFSYLDESFLSTVRFGDNSVISVMGKGNISICANDNTTQTISSVFYVPDLKSNLLSVGQLQEKGYEITIKDGMCTHMFPLHIQSVAQTCFSAKLKDSAWLWHYRYGHLNFKGLKTYLQQLNMVRGLPDIRTPTQCCEECILSKQHRDTFLKGKSWRAKNPLELVFSDICGTITPTFNGGKRYFITFIDDYSRKTWIYFLQEKSDAFSAFKSFKALAENEVGRNIKILRTDRGGEYLSREFQSFCETQGTRRQLTARYL
ncbi:unnamed protein product [Rhodiola kirilowii]